MHAVLVQPVGWVVNPTKTVELQMVLGRDPTYGLLLRFASVSEKVVERAKESKIGNNELKAKSKISIIFSIIQ